MMTGWGSESMNVFDVGAVAVILWCAVVAYRKGFLKASLGFLPMLAALGAAYFLSPLCSKVLRGTPVFSIFQKSVYKSLQLDAIMGAPTMQTQGEIIHQMQIPQFLKNSLLENNNPVVYQILNVDKIQDYIAGFFANIGMNILSVILVFIVTYIVVKLFLAALNLVFKLPVLSFFNRICGLAVGTLQGVGVLWMIGIVLTFFYCNPKFKMVFELLETSKIASVFYENNLLLLLILKIFA